MENTLQLKWGVAISQMKDLVKQAILETFKLLMDPTISNPQKALAPSQNNLIVMMFKQVAMGIGATSFTMEALVETLIANEKEEMTVLPSMSFSHCKLPLLGLVSRGYMWHFLTGGKFWLYGVFSFFLFFF